MHPRTAEFFEIQELVPDFIFRKYGQRSWQFLDVRAVNTLVALRILAGVPFTVNDKYRGGTFNFSGYRPCSTKIGASESQHRHGRAFDPKAKGMTPQQIHKIIRDNQEELMGWGLTTIEDLRDTPTWTHIDTRYTGMDTLNVVRP